MKIFLKFFLGIGVIGLIGVSILYFFFTKQQPIEEPTTGEATINGFPTSGGGTIIGGGSAGSTTTTGEIPPGKRAIQTRGSDKIVVNDFLASSTPHQDEYIGEYYLLNESTTTPPFQIIYTAKDQFFQISIEKAPLGIVRKDAETFLLTSLGINQQTACLLKHSVGVPNWLDTHYSGKNVEFSFCPGTVLLPEI